MIANRILTALKEKGYRLTTPRREIINVLAHHPQTALQIFFLLKKKKKSVDLASVYRTLEIFVDMGFVHAIELSEGKKRYELVEHENHHHHLICTTCGVIEDIRINENAMLKDVANKSEFKIDHHHLEFFGICVRCQ